MTRVLASDYPEGYTGDRKTCAQCSLTQPATRQFFQVALSAPDGLRRKCNTCRYEDSLRGPRPPKKPCERLCRLCGLTAAQVVFPHGSRQCRPCHNVFSREYHATHRERLNQMSRDYRQVNFEALRQQKASYYEAKRDEILQQKKRYYAERADEKCAQAREYHQKKPEVLRSYNQRRSDRDRLLAAAEEGKRTFPEGFLLLMYRAGYYAPYSTEKPLRPGAQIVCEVLPANWLVGNWEILPKRGSVQNGRMGEMLERWWRRKGLMRVCEDSVYDLLAGKGVPA